METITKVEVLQYVKRNSRNESLIKDIENGNGYNWIALSYAKFGFDATQWALRLKKAINGADVYAAAYCYKEFIGSTFSIKYAGISTLMLVLIFLIAYIFPYSLVISITFIPLLILLTFLAICFIVYLKLFSLVYRFI